MKKLLLSLLILVGLFTITGCGKTNKYEGDIVSFKYHYGSYNEGYYEYNINTEDNKVIFIAKGLNGVELNIEKEIDSSYLKQLSEIINNNNINEWNDFDKSDKNILDGYSFTLEVHYSDGKTLKAHGYMKYPKNYDAGHKALINHLNTIK